MKQTITYIFFSAILLSFSILISRDFRVSQIPNGNVNSCSNCHVSAGGGGTRTSFGETVRTGFLSASGAAGQVQWGPELAALDSDGDGFTNGEELQDPTGAWRPGQPAPGNSSFVTNPGNANSKPDPTGINDVILPGEYSLLNNYPNPFNPSTTIAFSIPEAAFVKIEIFNSLGQLVKVLAENSFGPGTFNKTWNADDEYGYKVGSGMYIYRMTATSEVSSNKIVESKRMLLIK